MAPGGYLFMGHSENIGNAELPLQNIASAVYKNIGQE
jgi:chemotaxis methyl-accepting protein methylase